MRDYEVLVRSIKPCGGKAHDQEDFIQVRTDSPEAYVREHGAYPILDQTSGADGDVVITTGDGHGNFVRYTFAK